MKEYIDFSWNQVAIANDHTDKQCPRDRVWMNSLMFYPFGKWKKPTNIDSKRWHHKMNPISQHQGPLISVHVICEWSVSWHIDIANMWGIGKNTTVISLHCKLIHMSSYCLLYRSSVNWGQDPWMCKTVWIAPQSNYRQSPFAASVTTFSHAVFRMATKRPFILADNYRTVGADCRCRVSEVQAGTTSPMPDHEGFKLQ